MPPLSSVWALQAYRLAWLLLLPLALLSLALKARRMPGYRIRWLERVRGGGPGGCWGRAAPRQAAPRLWVHAVSVGETRAAAPLIRAWLAEQGPGATVLLTQTTPTGLQTAESLFADLLQSGQLRTAWLCWDLVWACRRLVRWAQADLLVLMETEVWPELLHAAAREQLPVVLVNARLSARSAAGYRRVGALTRPAFAALRAALAQSAEDGDRLRQVGVEGPIDVVGSLKFDLQTDPELVQRGLEWRKALGLDRPVWMVVSSREGDERLVLDAWRRRGWLKADGSAGPRLLLVPRHPQRFEEVAAMVRASAEVPASQRSHAGWPSQEASVLLGDSLGEVTAYIAMSDLVLVGGSLQDHGGQNPLEAAAQGRPVFWGPSMRNFTEIARDLESAGAGEQVRDADDWLDKATALQAHPLSTRGRAEAAQRVVASGRGAVARTLAALGDYFK